MTDCEYSLRNFYKTVTIFRRASNQQEINLKIYQTVRIYFGTFVKQSHLSYEPARNHIEQLTVIDRLCEYFAELLSKSILFHREANSKQSY